eukprot:5203563-Alexandrium_andersonii.AAC.1
MARDCSHSTGHATTVVSTGIRRGTARHWGRDSRDRAATVGCMGIAPSAVPRARAKEGTRARERIQGEGKGPVQQ